MIAARGERLVRALRLASIAAIGIALLALIWRPRLAATLPDAEVAPDSADAFPPQQQARSGDAQGVVANNIFAASRRAPGRRYAPATDASAAPDAAVNDPGIVFDPAAVAPDAPSLLGTVIDALGSRALLILPSVDSLPKFYGVGERVGAYRVRKIEAGRVTVDGPNGRLLLQLKPNETRP